MKAKQSKAKQIANSGACSGEQQNTDIPAVLLHTKKKCRQKDAEQHGRDMMGVS